MEDILKLKNDELQIPVTLKDIQDAIGHVKSSVNAVCYCLFCEFTFIFSHLFKNMWNGTTNSAVLKSLVVLLYLYTELYKKIKS